MNELQAEVTVKDLRLKVDQFIEIKERIKDLESSISDLNKKLKPLSDELNELMASMELTRFEGAKGKVNRVVVNYVSNPATDEDKEAFFDYLKSEGMFESMVSVHHQKLNSYYKDKLEMAMEAGEPLYIPGLEPKQRIEIRKTR